MIIKKVRITNYKTYLSLDLDLSVNDERPIILIGGMNGGGQTTLFEAICGALYGLKIHTKDEFEELLNNGAIHTAKPEIQLEVTFVGRVLGQEQKYVLRRTYILNPQGKPVESVYLNMQGNTFVYGTATPAAQRAQCEQQVNKIIKANLPQELSKYFLFDAMQSSELLKKNVFAQIIKDNIENVMGFKKYLQLKRAAEKLQQEWAQQRLEAEKEAAEYNKYCQNKQELEKALEENEKKQDDLYKFITAQQEEYERAKVGAESTAIIQKKIYELAEKLNAVAKKALDYCDDTNRFVDDIEVSVFLPKLANNLSSEVEQILRLKEDLKKTNEGICPLDTLKDVTNKIVSYLKGLSLCSDEVDEDNIVKHIVALQNSNQACDPYEFLEENEVTALRNLIQTSNTNRFVTLDRIRMELEVQISSISQWEMQKQSLEASLAGGNEALIKQYENAQKELERLKTEEGKIKAEIKRLEGIIHRFDVQIQQEPDIKYDTLVKLKPFFEEVADGLLKKKKAQIETEMQQQLNNLLISYKGCVARVELSDSIEHFNIKMYHKAGNLISLNQLNAASKQIFIQVLLKVLRNLGDYNPPVMIDTVMGVLDNESRDALMEEYFPQLAEQTILLCTTSEIRKESDYIKLEPFISKTYTLHRDVESQSTTVTDGYFGVTLNG